MPCDFFEVDHSYIGMNSALYNEMVTNIQDLIQSSGVYYDCSLFGGDINLNDFKECFKYCPEEGLYYADVDDIRLDECGGVLLEEDLNIQWDGLPVYDNFTAVICSTCGSDGF